MPLSPLCLKGLLLVVALGGAAGSFAASAQPLEPATPGGLCFDVVRGPSGDATGAILVNRCTGKTWILARTRTKHGAPLAYRWLSIAAVGAENAASEAQQPHARASVTPNDAKCFTFEGRRFCE